MVSVLISSVVDRGFDYVTLKSLKKFIFRYQDLVEIYSVSDGFSYSENVYR
jgi:hypothetical protein